MKVLVTSMSGSGHIHPLVPMISELQLAGHDVVWATGPEACPMVERYGFRALPAGWNAGDRHSVLLKEVSAHAARLPARERRLALMPTMFGEIAAPRMCEDLVGIIEDYQPDVVIHDVVEFAAAPVAAARGIPHVTLAFGAALPPPLLQAVTAKVADIWSGEGIAPSPDAGLYDHLYLHPLPSGFGEAPSSRVARSVRPMHFDGAPVSDVPGWIDGFGRDRPGIYVTFGTVMANVAPWQAVIEAAGSLDADVVATIGSKLDPSTLGVLPGNVRVESYVPQTYLLERTRIVVSHSGSGTLFATAARGIPQLCVPIGADQWENADALASAGAGIVLEANERDPDRIHQALRSLLDGQAHQKAARVLAEQFAALPHPRELVSVIETLP